MEKYLGVNQYDSTLSTNEERFDLFFFSFKWLLFSFLELKLSDWEIENDIEFSYSSSSSSSLRREGLMGQTAEWFRLKPWTVLFLEWLL